ncbi:MAG: 3'-5' exonuclease, partial [Pseudomonas sp.]|nr:3'-5' exonuclease [Pseudomonas sp.]
AGERHHASADALATAELMLILFSRARQQQIDTPQALNERLAQWKRRKQSPSL